MVSSEFSTLMYNYHVHNFIYWTDNPELLMQYHTISMWLGPVFARGSLYAYFFFAVWIDTESTYSTLLIGYLGWLSVFGLFLSLLRTRLTGKSTTRDNAQLKTAGT